MPKKKKPQQPTAGPCLRLDPEERLCPIQDAVSIDKYRIADRNDMGFRVKDNFPEEHIQ